MRDGTGETIITKQEFALPAHTHMVFANELKDLRERRRYRAEWNSFELQEHCSTRKGGVIKVESKKMGTLGNWAYCPTGMD